MKLWLDDVRDPVQFTGQTDWTWIKTAEQAIALIATGQVTEVSLDHDLGIEHDKIRNFMVGNGYMVASFIEELAVGGA